MSNARKALIQRILAFRKAVEEPTLASSDPLDPIETLRARIIRNGLAVVAFACMEDFIRCLVGERLQEIASGAVPFAAMPLKLRESVTLGAVRGLRFQAEIAQKSGLDAVVVSQLHAASIASTNSGAMIFSKYSLAHAQSNISWRDIDDILGVFGVSGGKDAIDSVGSKLGAGPVAPSDFFKAFSQQRHKAAHDASANIEVFDLRGAAAPLLAFCASIDCLLRLSVNKFASADAGFLSGDKGSRIKSEDVNLKYIEETAAGSWRELKYGSTRALAISPTLGEAKLKLVSRKKRPGDFCIVVNNKSEIVDWIN